MVGARISNKVVSLPAITALVLAFCATSCASSPADKKAVEFCAILSDSVGLYVSNPVTQMGYKIGTVRTIEPRDADVKVGFTIDDKRAIPGNVKAVVRSPSILADRSLELVGNYSGGQQLKAGECIPRSRSFTQQSISRVIGSATNFVNAINPGGSTNIKDALKGIDQAVQGNGQRANELLTRSSALLDDPDQATAELGTITRNMAELTTMIRANRVPLKEIVQDMAGTTPDVVAAVVGARDLTHPLPELILLAGDLELKLGPEIQLLLDEVSEELRIWSPHYKWVADALNPLPRFISGLNGEPPGATAGGLAKHINNHVFDLLTWRPPLYRIPTPNGLLTCGNMNATMPGSCADVGGRPYAVDVALLQYVLTQAARQ
ncbi:MlaD family protein [Mycobacterium marseillense]|uniref:MlaD family protein n=1 Tax=Mycobacterium marseillense TaxID=701042 RepID=UPI003BAD09C2